MSSFQISDQQFQFYADYFAVAADAGLSSARSLFEAIDPINRVDLSTFDLYNSARAVQSSMVTALRTSYETIFTSAVSLEPMRDSFVALANHIAEFTASGVDDYLTSNGLQVRQTYASIHRLSTGETISDANIGVD